MAERLIFVALMAAMVLAPFVWILWCDRVARRGLVLHADMDAALRRALRGESLITVEVVTGTAWRRGQVILGVPSGWDCLIKAAWEPIINTLPADYDLVIRGAHRTSANAQ